MNSKKTAITSLLFFSFFVTMGQQVVKIPFKLTEYNNLSISTIINKTDTVNLMFHTAANAVTLTEESVKKLKTLHFTENIDSIKSWGGQANSSRLSIGNKIRIGELDWDNVSISENQNSGQYTDGKFGIDLFKGHIIELDFDNSVIRLHKKLPKKTKKYQQIKLIAEDDELFLEAEIETKNSKFKNKFLIHSGYAGAILFDDEFAKNTKLNDDLKIIGEKKLKDSFGNVLTAKQVVLPALYIQSFKLSEVSAGFFDGAIGRQKISILGGDILKRFNWIIDAKREFVYLKTNKLTNNLYRKM